MNDIYEHKAKKYKFKYEKLLQELVGGTGILNKFISCKDIIIKKIELLKQKLHDIDTNLKETVWFNDYLQIIYKIDIRNLDVNWKVQEVINKKAIGITIEDYNIIKNANIEQLEILKEVNKLNNLFI